MSEKIHDIVNLPPPATPCNGSPPPKDQLADDEELAKKEVQLTRVRCASPSSVELTFGDEFLARLTLADLGLATGEVNLQMSEAIDTGLLVRTGQGREEFVIDSATLRYAADPKYAAKIDQSIRDLHMTPEEQEESSRLSELTRDPRWNEIGDEDDLFE